MLRKLLETISRNIVLTRQLPARYGNSKICVSPDSALRFWRGDLEKSDPTLFAIADRIVKRGDVIWDIGANIGLFSFSSAMLSGIAGQVLAVEPDTFLVGLLRKSNVKIAQGGEPVAPISVLCVAVSDNLGVVTFNIAERGRASNYIDGGGLSQTGGVREKQSVVTITLDWLLNHYPKPDILKVDVEGVEVQLFNGAKRVLSESRPIILCEVSAEINSSITALFKNHSYLLFDADSISTGYCELDKAAWNTLACPVEKLELLK